MLGSVRRAVESAIPGVADASILRPSRDHDVESSIRTARQAPREGLLLHDPCVLQRPRASAVRTFVDSPAKTGHVQDSRIHWTAGIEQDMSRTGLIHSRIRLRPILAAVITAANAALVMQH